MGKKFSLTVLSLLIVILTCNSGHASSIDTSIPYTPNDSFQPLLKYGLTATYSRSYMREAAMPGAERLLTSSVAAYWGAGTEPMLDAFASISLSKVTGTWGEASWSAYIQRSNIEYYVPAIQGITTGPITAALDYRLDGSITGSGGYRAQIWVKQLNYYPPYGNPNFTTVGYYEYYEGINLWGNPTSSPNNTIIENNVIRNVEKSGTLTFIMKPRTDFDQYRIFLDMKVSAGAATDMSTESHQSVLNSEAQVILDPYLYIPSGTSPYQVYILDGGDSYVPERTPLVHSSVPAPNTMLLLCLGLMGIAGLKRKFKLLN